MDPTIADKIKADWPDWNAPVDHNIYSHTFALQQLQQYADKAEAECTTICSIVTKQITKVLHGTVIYAAGAPPPDGTNALESQDDRTLGTEKAFIPPSFGSGACALDVVWPPIT